MTCSVCSDTWGRSHRPLHPVSLASPSGATGSSVPEPRPPGRPTRAFGFQVRSDRDKFVIFLDVKHFSPEDLNVKVQEDFVEIHGKHSERQVSWPPLVGPRAGREGHSRPPGPRCFSGRGAHPPRCSCLPVGAGGGSRVLGSPKPDEWLGPSLTPPEPPAWWGGIRRDAQKCGAPSPRRCHGNPAPEELRGWP